MENKMITVREAAGFLRISLPSVYKLIRTGCISHVKVGSRYIIPLDDFMVWVTQNAHGGDSRER